jgi:hypothetical protein
MIKFKKVLLNNFSFFLLFLFLYVVKKYWDFRNKEKNYYKNLFFKYSNDLIKYEKDKKEKDKKEKEQLNKDLKNDEKNKNE